MLVISSLCPLVGNILYVKAYERKSFAMAIAGRLLVGLSSVEMVNKQLIVIFRAKGDHVSELSRIRVAQIGGILLGILIGTIRLDERTVIIYGEPFVINFETISSYTMSLAWGLQLLGLAFCPFPKVHNCHASPSIDKGSEINLSASEHEENHNYRLEKLYLLPGLFARGRTFSDSTPGAEGSKRSRTQELGNDSSKGTRDNVPIITKPTLSAQFKIIVSTLKKTRKLVLHNIALPITFLVYGFACLSTEVLFTSCVIITNRYFNLSGLQAGCFLAFLAALILPTYFFMSYASIRVGERFVMKKALMMMFVGVFCFINYQALYHLFRNIRAIFRNDSADIPLTTYYDWYLGVMQYCISVVVMCLSSVCLEGSSLSLMSKVSPEKLNRSPLNCSVMTPLTACLGRILGNTIIIVVGFSHREIITDMVNSISFVLIGLCYCCHHVVKKHYFFLNGS
jgi:hypothetical protein